MKSKKKVSELYSTQQEVILDDKYITWCHPEEAKRQEEFWTRVNAEYINHLYYGKPKQLLLNTESILRWEYPIENIIVNL